MVGIVVGKRYVGNDVGTESAPWSENSLGAGVGFTGEVGSVVGREAGLVGIESFPWSDSSLGTGVGFTDEVGNELGWEAGLTEDAAVGKLPPESISLGMAVGHKVGTRDIIVGAVVAATVGEALDPTTTVDELSSSSPAAGVAVGSVGGIIVGVNVGIASGVPGSELVSSVGIKLDRAMLGDALDPRVGTRVGRAVGCAVGKQKSRPSLNIQPT
jgi:hypothetical protein